MKYRSQLTVVILSLAFGFSQNTGEATPEVAEYICPPCGCEHDQKTFHKPGRCPSCNMEFIRKQDVTDVAIVLFEGVQIIDFTGPYEVFGQSSYRVFTVSEDGAPLTTAMGMTVDPTYSIEDSPRPHILVVPGGNVHDATNRKALMKWISNRAETAKHVLSVCNGAFILAELGLLDGRSATTFYQLLDELEKTATRTQVVWDQRFVDNGKIITTAGLSSGIDGALHVISKLEGPTKAARVALHLEYDWRPEANYARAALADMHLPAFQPPKSGFIKTLHTKGDRTRWTKVYRFHGGNDTAQLITHVEKQLLAAGWRARPQDKPTSSIRSWTFQDRNHRTWTAQTIMTPQNKAIDVRIETQRAKVE